MLLGASIWKRVDSDNKWVIVVSNNLLVHVGVQMTLSWCCVTGLVEQGDMYFQLLEIA